MTLSNISTRMCKRTCQNNMGRYVTIANTRYTSNCHQYLGSASFKQKVTYSWQYDKLLANNWVNKTCYDFLHLSVYLMWATRQSSHIVLNQYITQTNTLMMVLFCYWKNLGHPSEIFLNLQSPLVNCSFPQGAAPMADRRQGTAGRLEHLWKMTAYITADHWNYSLSLIQSVFLSNFMCP